MQDDPTVEYAAAAAVAVPKDRIRRETGVAKAATVAV
jgi:hypothetical protein